MKQLCMKEENHSMKKPVFFGAASALITPFRDGRVDFEAMGRMIDWQIEKGIDALVVTGTTGENATLSDEEHLECIRYCVKKTAHRVPVIAGTGSNNTAHACMMTREAERLGADAVLLVTPYYNKTTQKGLIAAFTEIAGCTGLPCILYNVPSRTGCNMLPSTVAALADVENIVAIKEASGDMTQLITLASLVGDRMDIYSGEDALIVPALAIGGKGVISVLSNVMPAETSAICHDWAEGRHEQALAMQLKVVPFVKALFSETSPIPVKAALNAMGQCENELRLPLIPMEEDNKRKMLEIMRGLHLIGEE